MKLFVGKLSYSTTNDSLAGFFQKYSPLISCTVVMDKQTGQSKGFGFVELKDENSAKEAIRELNGKVLDGRDVVVNEAKPKAPRA